MASPRSGGGWNAVPQSAQAAGLWMRALLNAGSDDPYLLGIGTHSARTTTLSWLNKKGTARDVTAFVYARDAMAHPLRVFQELLDEVRDKSFKPDESRGPMTADERKDAGVPEG